MQVNVGNGAPSTRLTCIIMYTHDPARLRLHVLPREGPVGCEATGRFLRQDFLLGPHMPWRIGHWADLLLAGGPNTAQVSFWKIEFPSPSVMEICTFANPGPVHCSDSSTCFKVCVYNNSQDKSDPN